MEKRFLNWLGFGLIALAMLSVAVSLLRIAADLVDAHQKGGDLATWVGATFAGLAFAGTIWLARAETRRRHRIEKELQNVTAVQVAMQISPLVYGLRRAIEVHEECLASTDMVVYEKIRSDFKSLPIWTKDDIQNMLHLPNNCATHMSYCATHLEQFLLLIDGAEKFDNLQTADGRLHFYRSALKNLEHLLMSAESVQRECSELLRPIVFNRLQLPTLYGLQKEHD